MEIDRRAEIYDDLHHNQMGRQEAANYHSALTILRFLMGLVRFDSVLDVGCGLGSWLKASQELGIKDVHGIEGSWVDKSQLRVDPNLVTIVDLEKGFSLGRKFGLVICLEVGEHLSPEAAPHLVSSLAQHSDVVLFSAAIPFQGGHHHVNEQFPDYWSAMFAPVGFYGLDLIRRHIWRDKNVIWWLRQNILVYAHERVIGMNRMWENMKNNGNPLALVHPDHHVAEMRRNEKMAKEYTALMGIIHKGGDFRAEVKPNGIVTVTAIKASTEEAKTPTST